jgi:hypothetical protein
MMERLVPPGASQKVLSLMSGWLMSGQQKVAYSPSTLFLIVDKYASLLGVWINKKYQNPSLVNPQ